MTERLRVCVETGRAERFKEHELAEALAEDPGWEEAGNEV